MAPCGLQERSPDDIEKCNRGLRGLDAVLLPATPESCLVDAERLGGLLQRFGGGDDAPDVFLLDPFQPAPFLFFFGPENSGKSIFYESLQLLVTKGVVEADRALTNANDFNGELAGAIICAIEEKDITKAPGALARNGTLAPA